MSSILVRDLDAKIVGRLKAIAKTHGRSLQGEVKAILTEAISFLSVEEAALVAAGWRKKLKGRQFSDSASLIREDRDR
jgi:plasmid stability protein